MHSLAVRLVPDESGHQAPQTDESDHERQERLRELSPHTSPLLLVFPFRGPPLSVSLPLFLLVLLLPCTTRACFIYPVPLPMFSYFQTRFALPRSTSQAHTPARWRLLNLFPHACLLFYALITPASLAHSLPVSFASVVQIPPRSIKHQKFSHFCLSSMISFPPDWSRQVWAPVRTSVTLVSSRYTLVAVSRDETDRTFLHILLKFSPLLLCSSAFFMLSRTFFVICSHEESPPFLLNYSSVLAPFSRASVCTFPSLCPHWLNPSPLCTKST